MLSYLPTIPCAMLQPMVFVGGRILPASGMNHKPSRCQFVDVVIDGGINAQPGDTDVEQLLLQSDQVLFGKG